MPTEPQTDFVATGRGLFLRVTTAMVDKAEGGGKFLKSPGGNVPQPALTYAQEVLSDLPLAYWPLGEAAGLGSPFTAADASGNAHDATYSNDGTAVTGATLGVGGIPGGEGGTAVEFAGGSVECSTVPDLTGDWTVAFWLKTTSTANSTIYYRGGAGASSKQFYVAYFGGSGGVLNVGVPDVIGLINSVGSVNDGAWHHVAVRREGDVWTLFIDGAVDSTVTNGVGQGSHPLTQIGTGTLGSFAGVLDEFAVWGTALSDARIIAHHLAGV